MFVVADDPSIELRFQVQDDQAHGYGRYRNGWFVGLALRSDDAAYRARDGRGPVAVGTSQAPR